MIHYGIKLHLSREKISLHHPYFERFGIAHTLFAHCPASQRPRSPRVASYTTPERQRHAPHRPEPLDAWSLRLRLPEAVDPHFRFQGSPFPVTRHAVP